MASDKQRRKAAKQAKKQGSPPATGAFRHPDGDRRHRAHGARYREAMEAKEMLRKIGAVDLPADDPEDSA